MASLNSKKLFYIVLAILIGFIVIMWFSGSYDGYQSCSPFDIPVLSYAQENPNNFPTTIPACTKSPFHQVPVISGGMDLKKQGDITLGGCGENKFGRVPVITGHSNFGSERNITSYNNCSDRFPRIPVLKYKEDYSKKKGMNTGIEGYNFNNFNNSDYQEFPPSLNLERDFFKCVKEKCQDTDENKRCLAYCYISTHRKGMDTMDIASWNCLNDKDYDKCLLRNYAVRRGVVPPGMESCCGDV